MRLALGLLYTLLLGIPAVLHSEARKLVVISIDGLDARYLREADKLHLKIPALRKLMKQGATADGVIGVLPNNSWAANTTMVTGVPPGTHTVLDAASTGQTAKTRTLWQAAKDVHKKTALLYWPASVGADADYNCPQYWEGRPSVDLPFDPIARKCTAGLVERVAKVYPDFTRAQWNDVTALEGLRYLLPFEQPDLTLVHLDDLDGEERETGALSLYSREVLENDDDLLGQALAKLPPHTVVAVVSDHGYETERYIVRPRVLIHSSAVEVRYGLIGATDGKTAASLRKALGNKKNGIAREIPVAEVKRISPDVTGWVAAFSTAPGYVASDSAMGLAVGPGSRKGVHELWPTRTDFRSVFVLSGDGVRPMRLGEISMLDIAPTFAEILGVSLPAARGTSLWPKVSGGKGGK